MNLQLVDLPHTRSLKTIALSSVHLSLACSPFLRERRISFFFNFSFFFSFLNYEQGWNQVLSKHRRYTPYRHLRACVTSAWKNIQVQWKLRRFATVDDRSPRTLFYFPFRLQSSFINQTNREFPIFNRNDTLVEFVHLRYIFLYFFFFKYRETIARNDVPAYTFAYAQQRMRARRQSGSSRGFTYLKLSLYPFRCFRS